MLFGGEAAPPARLEHFPIPLTRVVMAVFDQVRPGQRRFVCRTAYVDARVRRAHGGRVGGQPYRKTLDPETPVGELDDGAPVTGEYALHWRSGVGAKVRVLTS